MTKKIINFRVLLNLSIIILSFSFLFLSKLPELYEASLADKVPRERIMIWGEHIYTYDYNVDLSKIRQGMEGRWSVVDKYDSNSDQKGAFLQMFYLLSGKMGRLIGFTPVLTYHFLVLLTSSIWILTIIFLNKYFLKKTSLFVAGVLVCLFAGSFPLFFHNGSQIWIDHYMPWWQEMDILKRINYLPHYMINYISLSVLTILIYKLKLTGNRKILLLISLIVFFLFFIHPYGALIFLFSWILYHLINLIWFKDYNPNKLKTTIVNSLILFVVSIIPLTYLAKILSTYPWNVLNDEKLAFISFNIKDYFLALGPILLSGLAGLIAVFYFKKKSLLPIATWFLGSILAIFIFHLFPLITAARFIQSANHIPLAILSVYFFSEILKRYKNPLIKIACYLFVGIIILNGLTHIYYSLKRQTDFIRQRVYASVPLVPYPSQVMYPLKDFWNAVLWLEYNTKDEDSVLSKVTAGNYIPAYAGNFVYLGHFPETPDYHEREAIVKDFFAGGWPKQKARDFLNNNHISYVFYGPQEKEIGNIEKYDFIKVVFTSQYVTIFKIVM